MNETATAATATSNEYQQFVWRRLEEPLKLAGTELPWQVWLVLLGVVLAVAFFYVAWMYVKDSHGVGPLWASLLGFLRCCVYAVLSVVFLLPSRQTFLETRTESKVLVIFDVSGSMQTSDYQGTGRPNEKLPTRSENVLNFLTDPKAKFLAELERKNPVTVYRFGTKLDDPYLLFSGGRVQTREEKENPARDGQGREIPPEQKPLPEEYWRFWLNPQLTKAEMADLDASDRERLNKLMVANAKARKEGLHRGTNLGDSLRALIDRELQSRLQGVIVFTDGRENEGSGAFRELAQRTKAQNVPLFVVGVGEDRQKVQMQIVDLRLPQQIQPEDRFRAVTELTGEGLAAQKADLRLEITHVRKVKVKEKDPKTGKIIDKEKEEPLDIEVIEAENPDDPKSARLKFNLTKDAPGKKLVLKPANDAVFDRATPPRLEVEWQLDAVTLAGIAPGTGRVDLTVGEYRTKKWELVETKEDSEYKFQVLAPMDKREPRKLDAKTGKPITEHASDPALMRVVKKPLRVLLVTSAAGRDYQFVRTLLVREMEKKRLELVIHLQLPPGEDKPRPGRVQDVPPERLLTVFPDTFEKKKDYYDLQSYDVLVMFDPDWNRLSKEQTKLVQRWANKGGGIVMVGGHINTVELIRPREGEDTDRFKPILDLLPVVLDDRRDFVERKTDEPFALVFDGATPEMEFLKLDEELDESKFKEDWQDFFFGKGKERTDKPQRGFFNFYPVQKHKPGSIVIARYTDQAARLKDNTLHPYFVMNPEALPRVLWLGSAETWRLREYREEYHERFWTKLVRFAGARSKGSVRKGVRPYLPKTTAANRFVDVDVKLDGPGGEPLDRSAKPLITLKLPPGVSEKEIKTPIVMTPRPGAKDGWFSARFQVKSPGDYELTITVKEKDMEESATEKFTVKESNPELDNTRPDFDLLYQLASEADSVLLRMTDADKAELQKKLTRPKLEGDKEKSESRDDKMRLYFELRNADLIPRCMVTDVQKQTSRGKVQDLWDDGVTLWTREPAEEGGEPEPIKLSYVLMLVVTLLSLEWLIRKLLRLA